MADFLDFLLASPAKSPLPVEITPTTTLEDIIAATIQPEFTSSEPDNTCKPSDVDEDDEALAVAILAEATAQESEITSTPQSPVSEARFVESLTSLLGSPPPVKPLSHHPVFEMLQTLLESEKQTMPDTLLSLLQKSKPTVFTREQQLQQQFNKLNSYYPTEVSELSSFFKYQSAVIETERYQSLHQNVDKSHLRDSINNHYDEQLHKAIDRVELSTNNLQQTIQDPIRSEKVQPTTRSTSVRSRPQLSRRAIQLMEDWYQCNIHHPYPDYKVTQSIAYQGNIREEQVKKWFANKRSRSHNTQSRSAVISRKMSTRYNRNAYRPY